MLESYKDLIVWQRSIHLVKEVYRVTAKLPKHELYGLASQMRRAAVSVPSNIAEGYQRRSRGEYRQFLGIANASAAELDTQIVIVQELYSEIDCKTAESLIIEVQKMLHVLIKKLSDERAKSNP